MKEYQFISLYDNAELSSIFYTIHITIEQGTYYLLDRESSKITVDEAFKVIACKRKFEHLNKMSKGAVRYSNDGFILDNHKFETLDEVERAWKMKVFM